MLPDCIATIQFLVSVLTLAIKNLRLVLILPLTWSEFIYIFFRILAAFFCCLFLNCCLINTCIPIYGSLFTLLYHAKVFFDFLLLSSLIFKNEIYRVEKMPLLSALRVSLVSLMCSSFLLCWWWLLCSGVSCEELKTASHAGTSSLKPPVRGHWIGASLKYVHVVEF